MNDGQQQGIGLKSPSWVGVGRLEVGQRFGLLIKNLKKQNNETQHNRMFQ